jgi:hypothetical protein
MVELVLTWTCGCSETFPSETIPPDGILVQSDQVCPPECWDCLAHGRPCATREQLGPAFTPATFEEVTPIRRRYTRMKW